MRIDTEKRVRGRTRGQYAGLTIKDISQLMGCNYMKTRHLLRVKMLVLDMKITLADIGEMIFEYRQNMSNFNNYFDISK